MPEPISCWTALQWPFGFSWDDRPADQTGEIVEKKSGAIFGHAVHDSNNQLRYKFIGLSFIQVPVMLMRIVYRIIRLFHIDFVDAGIQLARREWQLARLKHWKHCTAQLIEYTEPSWKWVVAKNISLQLIKNILKIATYPLAIVGMELVSVYGLINPLSARAMYGMIEHAWSRDVLEASNNNWRLSDYFSPCMQPKAVWEERNLYMIHGGNTPLDVYQPATLRAMLCRLNGYLEERKEFFQLEFAANQGKSFAEIHAAIISYQSEINRISPSDHTERDWFDNPKHNDQQKKVAELVMSVMRHFRYIEFERIQVLTKFVQDKAAGNPIDLTKNENEIRTYKTSIGEEMAKIAVELTPPFVPPLDVSQISG